MKLARVSKGALGACLWALLLPAWAQAEDLVLDVGAPAVEVVPGPDGHASFVCPDAQWLSRTGEPDIPWHVMTILLPPDALLETLAVRLAGAQFRAIAGQWTVRPVPPEVTWDEGQQVVVWPADKTIVDGRDTGIYGNDASWPAVDVRLLNTGRLRKWRLAQVAIPLVKANPVQGSLQRLTAGELAVSFQRDAPALVEAAAQAELVDSIGEDRVRRIAVNFQEQRKAYDAALAVGEDGQVPAQANALPGYVIITTSAIQSASNKLADFVAHKQLCGFAVQVITSLDFGGGIGDTAAENIRNWLKGHYVSDNIQYVLLIGDPHPMYGFVPMKMLWPRHGAGSYEESPSDVYYADLTGNWDRDHDGFYGEGGDDFGSGGVDRHWEVLVARIPYYGSINDLDSILQKTIDYQTQTGSAARWRTNALLPMEPSDVHTPGYHLGEQIKTNILVPANWSYHRVYDDRYGLYPPPETYPCTMTNVTNVWSSGTFGLTVWWTHGSDHVAADIMDIWHVPYLNDAYPAFTFQVSCTNAYPETTDNLAYELLKHGAVSTVAATRVSWYYVGQTYFAGSTSNAGMSYEYTSRVVGQQMSCGEALYDLKQVLTPGIWMNFTVFNIYGDPSTDLVPVEAPDIDEIPDHPTALGQAYRREAALLRGSPWPLWSVEQGPAGLGIDPNGVITWPDPGPAGSSHTVTIRAQNVAGSDEETWLLSVKVAPDIATPNNANTVLGQPYTKTPTLIEGSQPITWTLVNGPAGMTIGANGTVTWPDPGPPDTTHTVKVQANNDVGQDAETWQVTVTAPPLIKAVPDRTVVLDQTYQELLTLDQGMSLPTTWTPVTGPSLMTIDSSTGVLTWPNAGPADSSHLIQVRADNGLDPNHEVSWVLTVIAAPQIGDIEDREAILGQPYVETPTLLQGYSLPVTWALLKRAPGMTIDPNSGTVTWSDPGPADTVHTVTIRAQNSVASHDATWQVTVTAPAIIKPIPHRIVPAGVPYSEPATLSQGSALATVWSLVHGPAGMTIDPNSGIISWPNPAPPDSTQTAAIQAVNSLGSDQASWEITAAAPPIIVEIPDRDAVVGQTYSEQPALLQGGAFATWSLEDGPPDMDIDPNTGQVVWANPSPIGSTHTVTVRAMNPADYDDQSWKVKVVPIPSPPSIYQIHDDTAQAGNPYVGPIPRLVEGTPPVTWSLTSGPVGMTINAETGVVSWPTPTHDGSPFTITVRAQNVAGDDTKTWSLSVDPPQQGVTIAIFPPGVGLQMVVDGQTYKAPQTFSWPLGSTHQVLVAATQTGWDGGTYLFNEWDDGPAGASRTIVVGSVPTYTARMRSITIEQLTITGPDEIRENGSAQYHLRVSRSDGTADDVTAQATWRLSSSEYAEIANGLVTALEIDSDHFCLIQVTYEHAGHSWSQQKQIKIVNVSKARTLSISTSPATSAQPVRTTHSNGDVVAVTVPSAPKPDMVFAGWGGDASGLDNPLRLVMDADKSVVAVFQKPGPAQAAPLPPSWCAIGLGQAMFGCAAGLLAMRLIGPNGRRQRRPRRRP